MIFPAIIDLISAKGVTLMFGMAGLASPLVFLAVILFLFRWLGDIRRGWLAGIRRVLL